MKLSYLTFRDFRKYFFHHHTSIVWKTDKKFQNRMHNFCMYARVDMTSTFSEKKLQCDYIFLCSKARLTEG